MQLIAAVITSAGAGLYSVQATSQCRPSCTLLKAQAYLKEKIASGGGRGEVEGTGATIQVACSP